MSTLTLVVTRARAGMGLLLTILALSAATTAIIAGTLGYSQAAATTAARQALTEAVPTEAGVLVQTRVADDPVAQDVAARRLITEAFAPAQVRIQQTLVSEPRPVEGQSGRLVAMAGQALLSTDERFADLVDVVAGTWPSAPGGDGPIGGALHRGAAERYGVGVGDTLVVDGASVVVEAVWQPVDAQAAFWFGDPQVVTGVVGTQLGPLVVHPDAIAALGGTPFTRWTVQPDPEQIQPRDMALLAQAAATLDRTMTTPEVAVRGMTVEGDLAPTTATAGRQLATARALNVIPIVLLLLVSVIAVVQIARMQAAARAGEVELFVARGASRRQVLTWSLLESVVVAALATALGVGLALGLMRLVPAGAQQEPVVVRAGLAAGLAVLAALAAVSVLQVRAVAGRSLSDRSGRTRQVAALGALVLTVGAAALAWWQLRRYGSPLVVTADGERHTDLLAGAAPALLLAACAVVSMALLAPFGRLVEGLTRPSRRLTSHLAASQVSRRLVVYAVPVVLTVLATGATTVASLYAATSGGLRDDLAALGQGAQVRADLPDQPQGGSTIASVPDVSAVTGVTGSAPVWQTDLRVGSTPAAVTMLPVGLLEEVALLPDTGLDPAATRAAIGTDLAPTDDPTIPATATSLTIPVTMRLTPDPELAGELEAMTEQMAANTRESLEEIDLPEQEIRDTIAQDRRFFFEFYAPQDLQVSLLLWDPVTISVHTVEVGSLMTTLDVGYVGGGTEEEPDAGPVEVYARESIAQADLTVQLPATAKGRQIRGLTVELPQYGNEYDATVTIDGLLTDEGTDLLADAGAGSWRALEPLLAGSGPTTTQSGLSHDAAGGALTLTSRTGLDFSPNSDGSLAPISVPIRAPATEGTDGAGAEATVPVAVTPALAATNDLAVGTPVSLAVWGSTMPAQVAQIVPGVPGTLDPHAVLLDATTVSAWAQQTNRLIPPPDQLWIATDDPPATVAALGEVDGLAAVTGPGAVSVTDAAGAVRLVFWVASAGAVLLAITGIGAVATNLLRARRVEVAVLRALGMTPSAQARSRVTELLGVVGASAVAGLAAGWLVGEMVVPELARSTTLDGEVRLPAALRLELPVWSGLLGLLVAALAVVLLAQVWRVRAQALDRDYREEIR